MKLIFTPDEALPQIDSELTGFASGRSVKVLARAEMYEEWFVCCYYHRFNKWVSHGIQIRVTHWAYLPDQLEEMVNGRIEAAITAIDNAKASDMPYADTMVETSLRDSTLTYAIELLKAETGYDRH
jgi:hypothetical protein